MGTNNRKKIYYLKTKKQNGQFLLKVIKEKFKNQIIINHKFKILHDKSHIFFPLVQKKELINELSNYLEKKIEIISKKGIINVNYKSKSLEEALSDEIPIKYSDLIPKSYDIIGEIAIIEFDKRFSIHDKEIYLYKKKIANVLTILNKNVRSVYEKKSEIKGSYRLRELELLHGIDKSETIHKENNCIFKLDIKKTYFTPRLSYERNRIASSTIQEDEIIVDLFAGVGPFSIQIAKEHEARIYAFDVNPIAYKYLKENIKLNKLKGEVIPYNLDVSKILKSANELGNFLKNRVDRIIMNLPEKSTYFIDIACFLMKPAGGVLHFYTFSEKPNPIKKIINLLESKLRKKRWDIEEIINSKVVKPYSPKSDLVVIDLKMKSLHKF